MKKYLLSAFAGILAISLLSFTQEFDMNASVERGKLVYEVQCQSCHMVQGDGIDGIYTPLAGAENINDKNRQVKVILLGERGPLKVKGVDYNGEMNGFHLDDQQVSDVLNYIRNSWGNKGKPIRPDEIQSALKEKTADYQPY
jgi:mono/diheme cytochrome c family protein